MGSIYRRKQNGKLARKWTIAYTDEHGKPHVVVGFPDKRATQEKLRQLEERVARIQVGLPVAAAGQLRGWRDCQADYLAELERMGRSSKYRGQVDAELTRIAQACRWSSVAEVKAEPFVAFLAGLTNATNLKATRRDKIKTRKPPRTAGAKVSARTLNSYRDTLAGFLAFCQQRDWISSNIIAAKVPKVPMGSPGDTSRRPRARRALTIDEFRRLTTCEQVSPRRRRLYLIAGLSGLRANECRQLQPIDLTLGNRPTWHLRPQATKGKRLDKVPMLPEAAELVADLIAGLGQCDPVFGSIPDERTWWRDLQRAGIPKRDARGRQADFHSLRYFFCTLVGAVLPIQRVRQLMRHRDIRTTCNLYLDLGIEDVADQLAALPPLFRQSEKEKAG